MLKSVLVTIMMSGLLIGCTTPFDESPVFSDHPSDSVEQEDEILLPQKRRKNQRTLKELQVLQESRAEIDNEVIHQDLILTDHQARKRSVEEEKQYEQRIEDALAEPLNLDDAVERDAIEDY